MAQRLRKLQETFGRDMPSGESGVIGSKAAGSPSTSKDVETIQSNGKYLLGFFETASDQGTTKLPYTEEMNSILYLITEQLKYLFQNGVPEYKDDEDYYPSVSFAQDEGMVWSVKSVGASPTINFKPSINQDKWDPVYAPTEHIDISSSGAITIGYRHYSVDIDVSGGDVSISALDSPVFEGQTIHFIANGANIADIAGGNGIYSNGIFITENTGGAHIESVNVGGILEWRAKYDITADYIDGDFRVIKDTLGEMKLRENINVTLSSGAFNYTSTFPVPFATNSADAVTARAYATLSENASVVNHLAVYGRRSTPPADYRTSYNGSGATTGSTSANEDYVIEYTGKY